MSSRTDVPAAEALARFSPATAAWFRSAFPSPTPAQAGAWEAIASGQHTLVIAPTGSGKTLAAFLWALDRLATDPPPPPQHGCKVLYVSPLKALAVDVDRNLRSPLTGITQAAARLGSAPPAISVSVRTGDTPAAQRRAFARAPSDVLVTTPESLFLILTSSARESLRGVHTVILDEVHALAGTKRGAHLALSLERLDELLPSPAQRVGLSATVRPVSETSAFLAGGRPVTVVAPATPKTIDVQVEVPVPDLTKLDEVFETDGAKDVVTGSAAGGAQRASIWPAVEQRILELVRAHRSTIVFANSRRLTERLTARLNELTAETSAASIVDRAGFPAEAIGQSGIAGGAAPVVAKAHHGSMSREQRTVVEEELKSGLLPCVVATSSLELGIDMGAVDLVVQVEAPPSVASGLQRIGRGGHHVGAVSKGVVFPRYRGDLVSCAVVAERMSSGSIEELRYPRNPLDVLAQQIVAILAMESYTVPELAALVRRAAPFAGLPDSAFRAVLDMLAGRYPSEEFGELRARITWDRVTDELRGRPGAQRLAVTSGGTIPDRGLFTVTTPRTDQPGTRVGELDEEMVYESRVGDKILLGTSSWQVEDITHDRVIVTPAPGQPARMPFWKGDSIGRPAELGRAMGAFVREVSGVDDTEARNRLSAAGLDAWATDNLLAYLAEQRVATHHLPDDRTVVVERFRDELGDWRFVIHSTFGARVNGPWALAIAARLRERRGVDAHVIAADDGIVLRLADAVDASGAEVLPEVADLLLEPDEVEPAVLAELGNSALFAARFRECAARSLLLPRRNPGRRSPLWQQRQRSAQLLSVAGDYDQFPVLLEATRECMTDVYDTASLRALMSEVASRKVRVVEVATPAPSPFARSLLFAYVGMFLYESDVPLAERRVAALSLDATLLAELLGSEAISELIDADVLAELEMKLQRLAPDRRVRDIEGAADALRFLGDLSSTEAAARGIQPEWLERLEVDRRALAVRIAGEPRWIAIEDAGRFSSAVGVALPVGVPAAFTEPVADPLGDLLARYARTHGPFSAAEVASRFGLGVAVATDALERARRVGKLVRGELRPPAAHPPVSEANGEARVEYCDTEVLRRLKRGSLARLRAEVEPVEPAALGRFLPVWHGIGRDTPSSPAPEDVLDVVDQLAGAPIPASALESLVLPARLRGYHGSLLDELTSSGDIVWTGAGALGQGDGWVTLCPAEAAGLLLPEPDSDHVDTPIHRSVLAALGDGALFFRQLKSRLAEQASEEPAGDETLLATVWDLVWAGLVSNDTIAPLRALIGGGRAAHRVSSARRARPRGRYARPAGAVGFGLSSTVDPRAAGRWFAIGSSESDITKRTAARADSYLRRHGVLTRGALGTERASGGFAGIYRVLRAMEEAGKCRRAHVVEGLGGAQFAVAGAIDQLRTFASDYQAEARRSDRLPHAVLLAASDPAQPWGAALAWPAQTAETSHRPGRKAGAVVVLVDGTPALYVERGGRSLLSFTTESHKLRAAATELVDAVRQGHMDALSVERADGAPLARSELGEILAEAGFRVTPKGLRLRA